MSLSGVTSAPNVGVQSSVRYSSSVPSGTSKTGVFGYMSGTNCEQPMFKVEVAGLIRLAECFAQRAVPLIPATKRHKVGNGVQRLGREKMRWTFYCKGGAQAAQRKKGAKSAVSWRLLKVCGSGR